MPEKIDWSGKILGVQPRIRLSRSFDQRSHSYLGYNLFVEGQIDGEQREFAVAIGKAAQQKHGFRSGDDLKGRGILVADNRLEVAELYKVSGLKILARPESETRSAPPFLGVTPELTVYRERGHRRLATGTFKSKCRACIWGCLMPVELIIDHWNPSKKRFRRETFCYGPKSCPSYAAGPTRKVPGRNGMSWEEEDWVDEEATSHREPDE